MRLFLVMFLCGTLMAASRAVNPTCANNGDGTSWTCGSGAGYAYNNLPATVVRGDTYYLGSGTFTSAASDGLNWITSASGSGTVTLKKATASDYGGLSGWQASYGSGPLTISGATQFYIAISNVTLDGVYRDSGQISGYGIVINNTGTGYTNGVMIEDGASGITIQYLDIGGNASNTSGETNGVRMNALTDSNISNVTIQYNYIHDWSQDIILMRRLSNVTVHGNYLARNLNDGITHGQGISNDCSNDIVISSNTFRDIISSGQIATGMSINCASNNWKIYNNVFFRSSDSIGSSVDGAGIRAWDGYGTRTGWYIVGNTFAGLNPSNTASAIDFPTGSTGNYAYNNIFWACFDGEIRFVNVSTHDYNAFFSQSVYPSEANSQVSASDPFVSSAAYNFHLSGRTDNANELGSPYNSDKDSVSRPTGGWDIGAYQYLQTTFPTKLGPGTWRITVK
jgi:hypothetical protein